MLCDKCSNIEFRWFEDLEEEIFAYADDTANTAFEECRKYTVTSVERKFYIHHHSFRELSDSIDKGCYLCAALWFALQEPSADPDQEAIDSAATRDCPIVWTIFASRQDQYASDVWFNQKETISVFCGRFRRLMYQVETPLGPYAKIAHRVYDLWESINLFIEDESTRSEATFELAQLWYQSCLSDHPICANSSDQTQADPPLPKRVIDVMSEGQNPVLYEPGRLETARYICLSHCWGNTKPMQIDRPMESRNDSVATAAVTYGLPPLETWPKSFQDAVAVARKFKIQYLWIDNTSIKQGDQLDWATELQKMAQYFSNATFTLAPSWAEDDDAGIFHQINPLLTYPLCLIPKTVEPSYKGYYISLKGLNRVDEYEAYTAPLFSRAWVLQEQQLSRRLLRFGSRGIYWQCFSCIATPANIMPKPMMAYQHRSFGRNKHFKMHVRPVLSDRAVDAGYNPYLDAWYSTVKEFTSRNMKIKSDVLPAISGLAQTFAEYMDADDRYLAGLWQSDLMLGLLWTADVDGTRRFQIPNGPNYDSRDFSAPSWSWIAQCHRVIRLHFQERILPGGANDYQDNMSMIGTEVKGVEIEYMPSSEPYGQIKSGKILFKAKLPSMRISTDPCTLISGSDMINSLDAKTNVRSLSVDKKPFSVPALEYTKFSTGRSLVGKCDIDDVDSEPWLSSIQDGVVTAIFLPLIMFRGDPERDLRMAGLVLLPTGNAEEFVRIGRAEVDVLARSFLRHSTLPFREISVV